MAIQNYLWVVSMGNKKINCGRRTFQIIVFFIFAVGTQLSKLE
jgi:hypothetical protein